MKKKKGKKVTKKRSKLFTKKNKKLIFSLIFEALILIFGNIGIITVCGITNGKFDPVVFNYFTIISNLLCIFYIFGKVIYKFKRFNKKDKEFIPRYKGIVLIGILMTFLIYNFVLVGNFDMNPDNLFSMKIANICMHYIIPIMMYVDYFIFDEKGYFKKSDPFIWMVLPYSYFLYIVFMASFKLINFGKNGNVSYFPYDFMNADMLGIRTVICNVIIIALIFLLISYFIYIIDSKMKKKNS